MAVFAGGSRLAVHGLEGVPMKLSGFGAGWPARRIGLLQVFFIALMAMATVVTATACGGANGGGDAGSVNADRSVEKVLTGFGPGVTTRRRRSPFSGMARSSSPGPVAWVATMRPRAWRLPASRGAGVWTPALVAAGKC